MGKRCSVWHEAIALYYQLHVRWMEHWSRTANQSYFFQLFENKWLLECIYNQFCYGGIAPTYQSSLKKDPTFIPKKFRERQIPGETEEQRKLESFKLPLEIEKLDEESSKHQATIHESEKQIDEWIGKYDDHKKRLQFVSLFRWKYLFFWHMVL